MKPVILLLVCFMASLAQYPFLSGYNTGPYFGSQVFTSVQTGNWNDPATWGGTGAAACHVNIPCMTDSHGLGDRALLGNLSHTVTCPAMVACSTGTSPSSDSGAIALGAASYSAASAQLVINGTLTVAGPVRMPNSTWTNNGTITFDASWSGAPTTAAYSWVTNNSGNGGTGGRFVNQGSILGAGNSKPNATCNSNACRSGLFGIDDAMSLNYNDQGVIDCIGGSFQYVGLAATGNYSLYSNIKAANRTITGCTIDHMETVYVEESGRTSTIAWSGLQITNPLSTTLSEGTMLWTSGGTPSGPCSISNSDFQGQIVVSTSNLAYTNCSWTNVITEVNPTYALLGFNAGSNSTGTIDQLLWYVQPTDTTSDPSGDTLANSTLTRSVVAEYANVNQNSLSNNNLHPLIVIPGNTTTTFQNWFVEGNNISANSDFFELGGQPGSAQTLEMENIVQTCNQYGYALGSFINIDPGMQTISNLRLAVDNDTVCGTGSNPATDTNVMGVGAEVVTLTSGTIPHIYSSIFYQDSNANGVTQAVCGTPASAPSGSITSFSYNAYYYTAGVSPICSGSGSIGNAITTQTSNTVIGANRGPNWLAGGRRLINFDQFMGQPVSSTTWVSGQVYTANQIVSDQQAAVYSNAQFNWRFLAGSGCTTSASTTRPITGTAWTLCWEPASMALIRASALAGTTYTYAPTGAAGLGIVGLLNAWEMYGYTPVGEGATIASGGYMGTFIGAVHP